MLLAWAQGSASRWGSSSQPRTHPSQAGWGPEVELDLMTFESPFQPKLFHPRHRARNKRLWQCPSPRTPTPWRVLAPHQGSQVAKEVLVTAIPCACGHCRELEPALSQAVLLQSHCFSWVPFLLPSDGGKRSQPQPWQAPHIALRSSI